MVADYAGIAAKNIRRELRQTIRHRCEWVPYQVLHAT